MMTMTDDAMTMICNRLERKSQITNKINSQPISLAPPKEER